MIGFKEFVFSKVLECESLNFDYSKEMNDEKKWLDRIIKISKLLKLDLRMFVLSEKTVNLLCEDRGNLSKRTIENFINIQDLCLEYIFENKGKYPENLRKLHEWNLQRK